MSLWSTFLRSLFQLVGLYLQKYRCKIESLDPHISGLEVTKLCLCSTQLSVKFDLSCFQMLKCGILIF